MKTKTYIPTPPKRTDLVLVDLSGVTPRSLDRKYSRLKNKSQVFDDRRKRKPKYKPNYMED
jgi:hypothetical protein